MRRRSSKKVSYSSQVVYLEVLLFHRHVGLLYINGTDFRIEPIPLQTVRPFVMDTVSLSKTDIHPEETEAILSYLSEKVCNK